MDLTQLLCPVLSIIQDVLDIVLGGVNSVITLFGVDPIAIDLAELIGIDC